MVAVALLSCNSTEQFAMGHTTISSGKDIFVIAKKVVPLPPGSPVAYKGVQSLHHVLHQHVHTNTESDFGSSKRITNIMCMLRPVDLTPQGQVRCYIF